jgi:hypothetical protein
LLNDQLLLNCTCPLLTPSGVMSELKFCSDGKRVKKFAQY